jgi:hypothetical protein
MEARIYTRAAEPVMNNELGINYKHGSSEQLCRYLEAVILWNSKV